VTLLPRPVTRRDVKKFIDHCVRLRAFWKHYQILFESSELQRELLQKTAPTFFPDLNLILIEHVILQVCKLTDREITMGKRNLTIPFLVNNSDFAAAPSDLAKLERLTQRIDKFRSRLLPARNMVIAHLDLDAAFRRKALGAAPVKAWQEFWLDLQDFVAIMHKRYVTARAPFYLNDVGMMSDADQLVRALKESTFFHALLDDRTLTQRVGEVAFSSKYYDA